MMMTLHTLIDFIMPGRDIPFEREKSDKFTSAIIGLMLGVALLMMFFSLSLRYTVQMQQYQLSHTAFIEIPHEFSQNHENVNMVVALLENESFIEHITLLYANDIRDSLQPWLGDLAFDNAIKLPLMIELRLNKNVDNIASDWEKMRAAIKEISGGITVDSHRPWVASLSDAVEKVQQVSSILSVLLCVAIIAIIALLALTNLSIHDDTIQLLHRIGAEDSYVLRQFDSYSAIVALKGSVVGILMAVFSYVMLAFIIGDYGGHMLPVFSFDLSHIAVAVIVPVVITIVAVMASHIVVACKLRRMH